MDILSKKYFNVKRMFDIVVEDMKMIIAKNQKKGRKVLRTFDDFINSEYVLLLSTMLGFLESQKFDEALFFYVNQKKNNIEEQGEKIYKE